MSDTDNIPGEGLFGSSVAYRINSTASKINDAFEAARIEARDECLWLSGMCRAYKAEVERQQVVIGGMMKRIEEFEKHAALANTGTEP